jgi:hypothetical protein
MASSNAPLANSHALFESFNNLISAADSSESEVFYQKMKGDYFRYKVEVASQGSRDEYAESSRSALSLYLHLMFLLLQWLRRMPL